MKSSIIHLTTGPAITAKHHLITHDNTFTHFLNTETKVSLRVATHLISHIETKPAEG